MVGRNINISAGLCSVWSNNWAWAKHGRTNPIRDDFGYPVGRTKMTIPAGTAGEFFEK